MKFKNQRKRSSKVSDSNLQKAKDPSDVSIEINQSESEDSKVLSSEKKYVQT